MASLPSPSKVSGLLSFFLLCLALADASSDFMSIKVHHWVRESPSSLQASPFDPQVTEETSPLRRAEITAARLARVASGKPWPEPEDASFLQALRGEPVKSVPVWMMRQAGRYLPEFRAVRADNDFMKVCRDPELAAEVTVQPFRRYPQLSAVIIFSDILVVPQAMGQPLDMVPSKGPVFDWAVATPADMDRLDLNPDVEETLGYVFDAIYVTKQRVNNKVPVIGFCGAPWTILGYMVEGGGSKQGFLNAKRWLYDHPAAAHKLLQAITDVSVRYLVKQVDAGAQALQVFDTNAGVLPVHVYEEFGAKYMLEIAERVKQQRPDVPMIAFPKDMPLAAFKHSKYDAVSLAWSEDRQEMRQRFGPGMTLQGNLDAQVLFASKDAIRRETRKMLQDFGTTRYVANLGHGMEPGMDPEHAGTFISTVKEVSAEMLRGK